MSNPEKLKALQAALAHIEKSYGKEAVMRLGEKHARIKVEIIPTGALPLDIVLGVGGLPRGRVVEIFGPEASGKTTLCLSIVAQAQKMGGTAAYIDAEHAMDPDYAKRIGVDVDNLLISQPDSGEQALEIVDQLVRSSAIDVVVIDSVAALVPRAEIEGEMGDSHVGLQARLMSQALRKLTATIAKSKTCVIFINQLRLKIGVMYGNPETTPGGLALKFYSSVRLDIRRTESIKDGEKVIGNRVRVKVVKNKIAAPFQQAEFEMMFGQGIDAQGCVLDVGVSAGIIEKTGTWFLYKTERLGQGRDNAKAFLKANPAMSEEIEKAVRAKYLTPAEAAPDASPAESVEKPAKEAKEKEKAKAGK
jgi:recombination protein RecA